MSRFNPRRSFRDERSRRLYLDATEAGWDHRLDGAGHLAMTSPDGKTRMSLSLTGRAARAALNNEAVFKRWVRMQAALDTVIPDRIDYRSTPTQEAPPMGDAADAIKDEGIELDLDAERVPTPVEDPLDQYLCADGCGKRVSKIGGYARGHNPNSGGYHAKGENGKAKQTPARPVPSIFKPNDDRFSIGEVVDIATFIGDNSGLVEVRRLQQGLNMILKMRGNR